ncbi:bifunctional diguanylate cyclase/phosphodiesterase [Actinoplanes sp. NPDC051346]|uniref:putative bifunctional diguanylate cyclase/phosphodiesterase n=1 Tax=Actinoplanes sp. NPDC051346 TaxID=3155048 RepID=UPI003448749E
MDLTEGADGMVSTSAAGPSPIARQASAVSSRLRRLRRYAWRYVSGLGAVAILVGPFLPWAATQAMYGIVGLAAVAAAAVGIRLHRPALAHPWWLLVAAVSVATLGNVYWTVEFSVTGQRIPFGSFGDVIYLSAYPLLVASLWTMGGRRTRRTGWVDAAIVTSGLAVLMWTLVIDSFLDGYPLSGARLVTAMAFPLFDLAVVAVSARLLFTASTPPMAHMLAAVMVAALIIADMVHFAHTTGVVVGEVAHNPVSTAGWLLGLVFAGAATTHPSIGRPTEAGPLRLRLGFGLQPGVQILLALLGPAVTAVSLLDELVAGNAEPADVLVPLTATAVMSVLLVVRQQQFARTATARAADLAAQACTLTKSLEEQRALQERLSHQTLHDPLTDLANRLLLQERLGHALTRRAGAHGLLLLDLDGFKDVNDTLGHPVGDELLIAIAVRLGALVPEGDTLARLGGDEFAILLEETDPERTVTVATAVLEAIRQPFTVGGVELSLTTSIGLHTVRSPATVADAFRDVDLALYAAKSAGKNQVAVFTDRLRSEREDYAQTVAGLRRALKDDEFELHYQPLVDLATGAIRGVEALLRWNPPGQRPVPPNAFIPVAEQSGLIGAIGDWVLRRACTEARAWHERHGTTVSVNVAGPQLRDPGFPDTVWRVLRDTGLPPRALTLEITETDLVATTMAEADEVIARLVRIREWGVRVAIDDFGTGYSSLSYLRQLPVDILKIDRAFIPQDRGDAGFRSDDLTLTRAIVDLGASLRLTTVAEGVETAAQADMLRELNCPVVQGYHFYRPMPARDLEGILAAPVVVAA